MNRFINDIPIQLGKSKRLCAFDHQLGFWQIHIASNGVKILAMVIEKNLIL
jgi:hypothetical protein